jgi:hypothetical protein
LHSIGMRILILMEIRIFRGAIGLHLGPFEPYSKLQGYPTCQRDGRSEVAVAGGGGGGSEESMSMGAGPVGRGGKRVVMANCFIGLGGGTVLKSVPR